MLRFAFLPVFLPHYKYLFKHYNYTKLKQSFVFFLFIKTSTNNPFFLDVNSCFGPCYRHSLQQQFKGNLTVSK